MFIDFHVLLLIAAPLKDSQSEAEFSSKITKLVDMGISSVSF